MMVMAAANDFHHRTCVIGDQDELSCVSASFLEKMHLRPSRLAFLILSLSVASSTATLDGAWGTSATLSQTPLEDIPNGAKMKILAEGWRCDCWNSTEHGIDTLLDCRCGGMGLVEMPLELHMDYVQSLTLAKTGIEIFRRETLQPYRNSLKDLTLTDMKYLKRIEAGSLRNMKHLRSIDILEAPEMKTLPLGLFESVTSEFRTLRILRTGLEYIPDLTGVGQGTIMHMIDLESNKIRTVKANSFRVKAEQLILDYNSLESVDGWAFNGSEIGKLSLKGNRALTKLSQDAFHGLRHLRELDLSDTSITQLPTTGLYDLDILRITDTKSLKVIPSVYSFRDLREAWLTYSFHCCAFKFPARHDPRRYILHQEYLAKIEQLCKHNEEIDHTGQLRSSRLPLKAHRRRRRTDANSPLRNTVDAVDVKPLPYPDGDYQYGDDDADSRFGAIAPMFDYPFRDEAALGESAEEIEEQWTTDIDALLDHGYFHQTTATVSQLKRHALCGNLSRSTTPHVICNPAPDALNPCEDIMGYNWLRVCVWFVVITAVVGNLAVLVVLLSTLFDITVPKFLMCHLAFADLCMGAYLLILASMDLHSSGVYFNYAFDWQIGSGCQVAGFLTVFASQLSIYTLTILTLERWFAITYAIYLNRRLKLRRAAHVMLAGWVYSIAMAALPLFGISSYSTTSICLPMQTQDAKDVAYLICLLVINGLAFVVICVCYAQIYLSLGKETRHCAAHGEMTVAKKMGLLVFTDFACWAPIAFFGLTAVAGYPLIDVTRSKILLVFFYPLNSCANPYLYAILTAQYRKDLFTLLSRYGLFTKMAQQYKMAYSVPTTNSPFPLLPRATPGSFSAVSNGNSRAPPEQEEILV